METVIEARAFKEILARHASGVTVVTTVHDGRKYGMTVSAFSSASLEPPLVLVCIANRASSWSAIDASRRFAVNLLAHDQIDLARRFAGLIPEVTDRFAGVAVSESKTGAPILPGVAGFLDCVVEHAYPAGDHTIFVGRVVAGSASVSEPLFYHARTWRLLGPEAV